MIINEIFPDYGSMYCSTGNMFITGLANMGAEDCFLQLMYDLYIEGNPIFYFDNYLSIENRQQIINTATSRGYRICDINNKMCHCIAFDLFSLFLYQSIIA